MMSAPIDEAKLGKQVKELLRKFSEQEQTVRQLQKQLTALQSKNEGLELETEGLMRQNKKEQDMCESLERLSVELRKKKDETLEDVRAKESVETKARQELTQKFQGTIAEITVKMESDAEEQAKAVNDNKVLRARLSSLGQQVDLRAQQYEQLLKTRDVELRLTEAKAEHMREMAKGDKYRGEMQAKQLVEERKKEAELKEQLASITAKFDELQSAITKSNSLFKEYKGEMDKLTKRIKVLDNERNELRKRYSTKRKPHDTAADEVEAQRAKLAQLQKAGSAATGLMEILRQESADFENWKQACPEAYARAEVELKAKDEQ